MGRGADCQVHICLGDAPVGVRGGWASAHLGSAGGSVLLLRPGPDGRDAGGVSGSSGSGQSIPRPSRLGPPEKSCQAPGSPPLLSKPCVYSTCVRASFGFVFLSQIVVPKIANPRNRREAYTDANTRGFIQKLELVSKYTRQSRAGTWTLRWVLAEF